VSARNGLRERHARACRTRTGARCNCTPTWEANVWDNGSRKRITKTFRTKSEAKLWRRDAAHALAHGTMNAPVAITVAQAIDELLEGMRDGRVLDRSGKPYKPATIRSYERAARLDAIPQLGSLRLSDVRRRHVQAYVDELRRRGLSPSTVLNRLDVVRVVFRRAVRDERITVDPCTNLDLPAVRSARREIAGVDRAAQLVAALPDAERALWATAFYAGLRRGELRALRWRDVDFDAGVLRVCRGWDDVDGEIDPKSYAGTRAVPMAGALRRELAAHKLRTGRGPDDLVFGRAPRAPFVPSTIRSRARKAWATAELAPLTPHEARHTCASYLIAAGLNPKQVQTYIGHSDVRTTFNVYGHLLDGDEAKAAAQLDALLEGPVAASS
jgi:integrase